MSDHARQALAVSAGFAGVRLGELEKGGRGEPLPSNGVYWSLSHTPHYVAAVAAPHRIGIDIERIRPFTPAVRERVAGEEEWALAPDVDETVFCRFWTAKEAVLKAVGVGLGGLSKCSVIEIIDQGQLRLCFERQSWTVSHSLAAANHIAAVSIPAEEALWHFPDGDETGRAQ